MPLNAEKKLSARRLCRVIGSTLSGKDLAWRWGMASRQAKTPKYRKARRAAMPTPVRVMPRTVYRTRTGGADGILGKTGLSENARGGAAHVARTDATVCQRTSLPPPKATRGRGRRLQACGRQG